MCAVAEHGQFVQQRIQFLAVAGVLAPVFEQVVGVQQDVHAFSQKAGDQLRIAPRAQAIAVVAQGIGQPCVKQLLGPLNQCGSAFDGQQRVDIQLSQTLMEQRLGRTQQVDFVLADRDQVGLELANELIQRARQLGDRQDACHVSAAFEGMQRAQQIVAEHGRIGVLRGVEIAAHRVQVGMGFLAEDLQ